MRVSRLDVFHSRVLTLWLLVSMIDGRFWDKLEELGRMVRSSSKPFGGIQVSCREIIRSDADLLPAARTVCSFSANRLFILQAIFLNRCGDFFQLPPVPDRHDRTSVFTFQAKTWNRCIPKVVALTQVFRQKAGSECLVLWIGLR